MNDQLIYREHLQNVLMSMKVGCEQLGALALELIFFEDEQNGCVPFSDGDEIPLDLALLDASDIPSVRILGEVIRELEVVCSSLCNINNIDEDVFEGEPLTDEELADYTPPYPVGARNTFDDLTNEANDFISHAMFFILYDCYTLLHGEEIAEDVTHEFYFPEEETFAMFATDDVNVNRIVALARFLREKRDEAGECAC